MAVPGFAEAVAALRRGGLVVHPTETVYGIGVVLSAGDEGVERVRAAKRSPADRPYLLVAADAASAFALWREVPEAARRLAAAHWPGPLTLVGPAAQGVAPSLVGEGGGVAVRVPGLALLRDLAASVGEPFVSTSANLAGRAPPVRFEDVDLAALVPDFALDAGPCPGGVPSTLVSVLSDPPVVLRPGPVTVR